MGFHIVLGLRGDFEMSLSFTTCFEDKFQINCINWTKFCPIRKYASHPTPTPTSCLPQGGCLVLPGALYYLGLSLGLWRKPEISCLEDILFLAFSIKHEEVVRDKIQLRI